MRNKKHQNEETYNNEVKRNDISETFPSFFYGIAFRIYVEPPKKAHKYRK